MPERDRCHTTAPLRLLNLRLLPNRLGGLQVAAEVDLGVERDRHLTVGSRIATNLNHRKLFIDAILI